MPNELEIQSNLYIIYTTFIFQLCGKLFLLLYQMLTYRAVTSIGSRMCDATSNTLAFYVNLKNELATTSIHEEVVALPYLPAEHTELAFHKLAEKATTDKPQEVCEYIETT